MLEGYCSQNSKHGEEMRDLVLIFKGIFGELCCFHIFYMHDFNHTVVECFGTRLRLVSILKFRFKWSRSHQSHIPDMKTKSMEHLC